MVSFLGTVEYSTVLQLYLKYSRSPVLGSKAHFINIKSDTYLDKYTYIHTYIHIAIHMHAHIPSASVYIVTN